MTDLLTGPGPRRPPPAACGPAWARWEGSAGRSYTIGVEEEVMLLNGSDHSLAERSDRVLERLPADLVGHVLPETHAAVVELVTGVNSDAANAVTELLTLRRRLTRELLRLGVAPASAGMYPAGAPRVSKVSSAPRYRQLADSMRFLARREPTLALHVHVGVPDPDDAVRVLNRLRENVPLLLAVSANSPFAQGRDSGFASARTAIFAGFPRTGTPRAFDSYADYAQTIDTLIVSGALPDPTFLWWDVRLQPALGTVEVRVMDAQSSVSESAPLIALIQSLARLELDGEPQHAWASPEIVAENRFLAARDGLDARLIDPVGSRLVGVRTLLDDLVERCRPHAAALACSTELEHVRAIGLANGADRQRNWVSDVGDITSVVPALAAQFTVQRDAASLSTHLSGRND